MDKSLGSRMLTYSFLAKCQGYTMHVLFAFTITYQYSSIGIVYHQ